MRLWRRKRSHAYLNEYMAGSDARSAEMSNREKDIFDDAKRRWGILGPVFGVVFFVSLIVATLLKESKQPIFVAVSIFSLGCMMMCSGVLVKNYLSPNSRIGLRKAVPMWILGVLCIVGSFAFAFLS